ncbi:STE20-related kinase adapter protein alpha [Trichinella nelsoni]|uniref:STE20-related kinase adapter protein alpha n=1 Tax=Trichinella nelsoni TaxID=6336 RepID=A0A0V0SL26_9BILA|nr:STE20-related kinase adapter protein alpha [Trichinella nelsoni]
MSNSSNLIAKNASVSFCCVEVGRYVVFPCIGKANNRKYNVHLAKEKETDKLHAIRICTLEDEKDDTNFFFLQKEVRILSQLKHSNILQLVDVFVAGSDILIVTPLMDYGSVKDLIHFRYHFGLPEQLIATVLYDVLLALEYLHEHDFIHRSVRCSHILLSSQGKVCLSGFRLVASVLESDRRLRKLHEFTEDFQSSLMWFAPEVLEQNIAGYGVKSDIYSLGIAGCEMANGFVPFSNMSNIQMFWEKLRGAIGQSVAEAWFFSTVQKRMPFCFIIFGRCESIINNIHGGFLTENTFSTSLANSGSSKEFCDRDHDANTYWSFGD